MRFLPVPTPLYRSFGSALLLSVAFTACGGSNGDDDPVDPTLVTTDKGTVQGVVQGQTVQFLGVPYAAAPTGALRFNAPQPRPAWTGVRSATTAGVSCAQLVPGSATVASTTEDCLQLNITAPYPATRSNMPVFVYLHGGGFLLGAGKDVDPSALATAGNFIVVTVNYRLGVLGWLASSALDDEGNGPGNFGRADQRAALQWVKTNIARFGGDPNQVTLGGTSAGAMSTCQHLASPASQGLFQRVVVMSGPCSQIWDTTAAQLTADATFPAALGCTGTDAQVKACLRSDALSLTSLLAFQAGLPRGPLFPSVGGTDLPQQPRTALGTLPMLIGFSSREHGARQPNPADETAYLAALTTIYGATSAAAIAAEYPFASFPTGQAAMATAASDYSAAAGAPHISVCTNIRTFELRQTGGNAALYAYEFADPAAPPALGSTGGPTHTAELPYLFPTSTLAPPSGSQPLAATMRNYLANFINSGDPNGSGLPTWPAYTSAGSVLKLLPDAIAPTDAASAHHCAFWQGLGYTL